MRRRAGVAVSTLAPTPPAAGESRPVAGESPAAARSCGRGARLSTLPAAEPGVAPTTLVLPAGARALSLRRAATAILDGLDPLADALADAGGQPRTEGVLAELLPSVGGLHDLGGPSPAGRAQTDPRRK